MNKERRLGRGLEALLGRPLDGQSDSTYGADNAGYAGNSGDYYGNASVPLASNFAASEYPASVPSHDGPLHVNVYQVENNPFQPRRDFDDASIDELSASLQEHGMIQPLVVRRLGDRLQLIAGERRLRAAIKAGWQQVPVQVREADDRQMSEVAIVENLQRKDLNPLEKAASFAEYLQRYACTQEELAGRLKIDRSTIANLIRLLELPEAIQNSIRAGSITQGHARALLPLGDEREQIAFCQKIQNESLSVRATEDLVQQAISGESHDGPAVAGSVQPTTSRSKRRRVSQQVHALEQELRSALGTKVELKQKTGGRGQIVIHYTSLDEFERLRTHLHGQAYNCEAG